MMRNPSRCELQKFYGFQAEVYENQTHSAIKHILVDDYQKRTFKPNDELLIFFAGPWRL